MKKKKAMVVLIAFVIFTTSIFNLRNVVKANTDPSRFGEVLVSDLGTSPTIQNGNTTRKLAVASNGTIYATYHCSEGIRVAKSLDEGKTFQNSVLAYNKNLEAEIAVSTDGSVYLAWVESSNIKLSKSIDGGATFQTPVVVGSSSKPTVHIATDGNYIYIIDQAGLVLHRSIDAGATFSYVTLSSSGYVFSDVHVDPASHTVIVQEDNPSIKYYLSTDYGKTFGSAKAPSGQSVMYSVGSIGSDSTGKYLLIAGYQSTGVKINLDTGVVTNPVMGNNVTSQGRSLSDDIYGNMATGYSDNINVYLQVSHDLGSTFGAPITVAQSTIANASINTTNGDILFLYERAGKIYLKVYGNLLQGYNLNVSNSSLYFNADNNDISKTVTITNTSNQPLDINSITVSGDFSIDTSEVKSTLAANESAVVHVNYKHSVIGTTTGKISINYGSNSDVKYINLTGYVTKALPVAPVVSGPSDIAVNHGTSATFSVTSSITDNGTLSYQWQSSSDNGLSWNNVSTGSGATTNSYTTGILTSADSGIQYRCVVKNTIDVTATSTTSSVATLTINAETQPTINVTGVPADWKNSSKLTIDVTVGYSGVKSVTVNGNDITGSYSNGYTVTQNGSYTFVVVSNSGLTASQTVTVESIDSTAPNKAVIENIDKYTESNWYNTDQTVTAGFTPTQGSSEKVQYSLDGGKTWTDGSSSVVTKEGINIVLFRVIDDLGNVSEPQTVAVQIDKTNPSLSLSDVSGWKTSNVTIDVTAEDTLSGVKEVNYTTDETVPQTGTVTLVNGKGTITLTNEGQYKITVTEKDKAGNTISKSVDIQIDKSSPATPIINNVVDSRSTKITGTAEPDSKITVKDSAGNVIGNGIADTNGKFSISITKQTGGTVLYVSATDISGNVSDKSTIQVVTLTSHVADMIDALPNPNTASDEEIISKQYKITETKQSYDALDQDGRDLISSDRKEKLDSLISRLNALFVIIPNDKSTGIKIDGVGTAVVVDELSSPDVSKVEISLNVKPIEKSNSISSLANITIATASLKTSGQEILAAYDISLIKSIYGLTGNLDSSSKVNNSNIVSYITVRIPVPDSFLGRNDLTVVYIDDNGNVHPYNTKIVTIDGVRYLEFQTNHFSEYAIVANTQSSAVVANTQSSEVVANTQSSEVVANTQSSEVVATADTNPIGMLMMIFAINGITLFVFRNKAIAKSSK